MRSAGCYIRFSIKKSLIICLRHVTETVGIKYVHITDLGIESDKRSSLEMTTDYQNLFREYAKTLPSYTSQLEWVYSQYRSSVRIALMCYEKEAVMCHRHVIRDYIAGIHPIRSEDL